MRQWCDVCLVPCAHSREHANLINVYTLGLSPEKGPRSRPTLVGPAAGTSADSTDLARGAAVTDSR